MPILKVATVLKERATVRGKTRVSYKRAEIYGFRSALEIQRTEEITIDIHPTTTTSFALLVEGGWVGGGE